MESQFRYTTPPTENKWEKLEHGIWVRHVATPQAEAWPCAEGNAWEDGSGVPAKARMTPVRMTVTFPKLGPAPLWYRQTARDLEEPVWCCSDLSRDEEPERYGPSVGC